MAARGIASALWGRYDPYPPPPSYRPPPHIRLVQSDKPAPLPDPACDWIEDAEWWLARSERSTRSIQRAFEDQEMACVLYETVGAMIDMGREYPGGPFLIRIQVMRAEDWDVGISLSDAGIFLEEPWKGDH